MSLSNLNNPEPESNGDESPKEQEVPVNSTTQEPVPSPNQTITETASATPSVNVPSNANEQPAGPSALDLIMDRIAPVSTIKPKRKILIYSDPGAGKRVFSATAPGCLILDVEDGLASIQNHPELAERTKLIPFKTLEGAEVIVHTLSEEPPELEWVETFTVDSMSEMHKRGLAGTVERDWANAPSSVNRYVAETEHHTENNERVRRFVSSLRDLDRNVIITAHARRIEPKNRPAITLPDFSEKLSNTLAGIVDVVGYLYLKEVDGVVKRILRVRSEGTIVAKTRLNHPAEIEDPTWDKVFGDQYKTIGD
jgi:hypothetical protein